MIEYCGYPEVILRITLKDKGNDIIVYKEEIIEALACLGLEVDVKQVDACQVCGGMKNGVPGNENLIDGKMFCDYCSSKV